MSTPNFKTMDNFPLYAWSDEDYTVESKRCPVCGCVMDDTADECDCCGCGDLEDYAYFDGIALAEDTRAVEDELDAVNRGLLFHKITLDPGYYSGTQLYVEAEHDLDRYDYTNGDCHYYFDCCRSVAYRKYAAEKRRVARSLRDIGARFGFQELVCAARFSNGEAIFIPASSPRGPLYAAVA